MHRSVLIYKSNHLNQQKYDISPPQTKVSQGVCASQCMNGMTNENLHLKKQKQGDVGKQVESYLSKGPFTNDSQEVKVSRSGAKVKHKIFI